MKTPKKKLAPIVDWEFDAGFYSYSLKVKARTKGEARKKAMDKLRKVPLSKLLCPNTTYLGKTE